MAPLVDDHDEAVTSRIAIETATGQAAAPIWRGDAEVTDRGLGATTESKREHIREEIPGP